MNKKVMLSVAIILLAVAAVGGATMAWFTDDAVLENTFTAGTLEIDAEDYWKGSETSEWNNVNPVIVRIRFLKSLTRDQSILYFACNSAVNGAATMVMIGQRWLIKMPIS